MNPKWNGLERRKYPTDHDTLVCLTQIISNHVENVKLLSENFKSHEVKDEQKFERINKSIWTASGWVGGVIAVIVFISDIIFRK